MGLSLDATDRALLAGEIGKGARLAMQLLVRYAEALESKRFIPIVGAHIDGCLYHGQSGQDFVDRFCSVGARVLVPTTLNVAAIDLLHPDMRTYDPDLVRAQGALIDSYVALGCLPTLTCAPYQRISRPRQGDHVAWAESNAIVFANSVLGARTDRYGDFADICAALTGRVPLAGLHIDANRRPRLVLAMPGQAASGLARDLYFGTVGYVTRARASRIVPALTELPGDNNEDELKMLGAAAASSGATAMFHVVGFTPEAPAKAARPGWRLSQSTPMNFIPPSRACRRSLPVSRLRPSASIPRIFRRGSLRGWMRSLLAVRRRWCQCSYRQRAPSPRIWVALRWAIGWRRSGCLWSLIPIPMWRHCHPTGLALC